MPFKKNDIQTILAILKSTFYKLDYHKTFRD